MKQHSEATQRKIRVVNGIGLGTAIVLASLAFWFGIRPILNERMDLRAKEQELASEKQMFAELRCSLREQRKILQHLEEQIANQPLRLDPVGYLNRTLFKITSMAEDGDIRISQVDPGKNQVGVHYSTVPIRIAGNGSFIGLSKFLGQLHEVLDTAVLAFHLERNRSKSKDEASFEAEFLWYAAPGQLTRVGSN